MFWHYLILLAFITFAACGEEKVDQMNTNIVLHYPESKQDSIVDQYGDTSIVDPYRWLENDHADDTKVWVQEQNHATQGYLSHIPYRDLVKNRLEQIWNYERYGTPFRKAGKYYFFKNDGLQNQSVLYVQDSPDGEAKVVLDPNTFSSDGTVSLGAISFNKEGTLLAYQTSEGGSDWRTIQVLDLGTGELLDDKISWVKFSGISWAGEGFYYSRFPEPSSGEKLSGENEHHKVYYHKLGSIQDEDRLVKESPEDPQRNFYASTSDDERFLSISASESTSGNTLEIEDLSTDHRYMIESGFDHDLFLVDNVEDDVFILTNRNAPNWKLLKLRLEGGDIRSSVDVIPESEVVLRSVKLIGGKLIATFLQDAKSVVTAFDYEGKKLGDVVLPGIGSVGSISGAKDEQEAFYTFSSYTRPATIYSFDSESLGSTLFKEANVDFETDKYETVQRFFESKDGTSIPIFVTYKKGLDMDGNNPTLLYGYGGFDISLTPSFNLPMLVLLENGGIYAVANIRGGGEYGKEWHLAGTKERKQNVFDDFQAAAEFLIEEKYTSNEKLAIMGGSNGGLLVGACMTQRPDLFKVAIPRVGVLDMLRYHKFTIGWAWAEDYGRSDDPEAFEYLIRYSPLHNVEATEYPATFIMTADHDDRVVPAHSFKFAAALQEHQQGTNPVLIRIETSAGHGAGKPTSKQIEENADMLSFMFFNMNEEVIYEDLDR